MPTFVGAGQPELGELLHVIGIDPVLAEPWNRSRWDKIKEVVGRVRNVLSCVPHQTHLGEVTITVSPTLSTQDHQAVLDDVLAALESIGLHSGEANMMGLRLN